MKILRLKIQTEAEAGIGAETEAETVVNTEDVLLCPFFHVFTSL